MDEGEKMSRIDMMKELTSRECQVKFKKVNGDLRDMTCTLKEDIIPSATKTDPMSQKKIRAINDEVIPVWDVKAEGWRSFRVDSVVSFT